MITTMGNEFPEKLWIGVNSELENEDLVKIKYKNKPTKKDIVYIRLDKHKQKLDKKQKEIDKLTNELNRITNEFYIRSEYREEKPKVFD